MTSVFIHTVCSTLLVAQCALVSDGTTYTRWARPGQACVRWLWRLSLTLRRWRPRNERWGWMVRTFNRAHARVEIKTVSSVHCVPEGGAMKVRIPRDDLCLVPACTTRERFSVRERARVTLSLRGGLTGADARSTSTSRRVNDGVWRRPDSGHRGPSRRRGQEGQRTGMCARFSDLSMRWSDRYRRRRAMLRGKVLHRAQATRRR